MNAPFTYASPTLSVEALKHSIAYKLMFTIGKDPVIANKHEWLNATLFAVRDRLVERWLRSNRAQLSQETRQVYYLSMEFLIGRTLSNALLSLGIYDDVKGALEAMGLDLEELIDEENDPGLGNGGLGRLAACFLDSLATLGLPGRGYGIRYDYGMFKQNIVDGRQKESPDYWLEYGNPWEFKRHNTRYKVLFGGRIQQEGKKARWIETEEILAVAYDQIIPGYDTDATNTLRLWNAQASSEINLGKFNQGDYFAAVEDKNHSENVSRVLYPDDSTYSGRELRLRQEYFLVSATVQDILHRHYQLHKTYENLADKIAIHLNDTHPVLSIPELMRLLIDEHKFSWDDAFEVCCQVFSYTNHTLMSEALETWPVDMLGKILPRHLQIIFEINDYFLKTLQEQYPNDTSLLGRASIIDESNGRRVRMAWLAQVIIPAADLSEQISLAGTEASGTSNMKFALNGALTIGTLDGANVEMQEHVGEENIFIFGNTAEEVEALRRQGYKPRDYYEKDEELHQVLTQIGNGVFNPEEPGRYRDLVDSLINFGDHYQVLADYRSYVDCQDKVDELYRRPEEWTTKAMLNIANMGYFSSDRTIKEYAENIWHIDPVRL
ncbi:glycogen/starch/alpha-glucan family phosphorylase [Salmonella enterica subsp. enterica serovar Kottbus]|nr:glycogen/starch/alpha-glucan family phosphorylase [Salmonella enterica subsp. enterica serovar Kottbus]